MRKNVFIKRCHSLARRIWLLPLYIKYRFDRWHFVPVIWKPYVKDIVNYIVNCNIDLDSCIVECGCGLCDIVGDKKLKNYQRVGVDLSKNTCLAAKKLHKDVKIVNGSFDSVKNMKIKFLIAVNFIHGIAPEELQAYLYGLIKDNDIEYFILDSVTGDGYAYAHKFDPMFYDTDYRMSEKISSYMTNGGERCVYVYKKQTLVEKME